MNDKHFVYIHKMYNIGYILLTEGIATTAPHLLLSLLHFIHISILLSRGFL